MKKISLLVYLLGIMLLLTSTPTFASTIHTSANYTAPDYSPPSGSDTDSGSTGTVSSSVGDGVFDPSAEWSKIGAEASGNTDGYSAAFAGWRLWIGGDITADATVTWTDTLTAGSGSGNYSWDFTITNGKLNIGDWCPAHVPYQTAGYNISIDVDGSNVWKSSFEIYGDEDDGLSTTQSGTDLGGVYYTGSNELGYEFSSYSGSLDLGHMNAGDTVGLTYSMNVYVSGPDYETDAQAYFGDPGDLTGGGGMYGELTPVPVPATLFLLGSGIVGLAGFRRKFKKA